MKPLSDTGHDGAMPAQRAVLLQRVLQPYTLREPRKAAWLVASSLGAWLLAWYAALLSLALPYAFTLLVALVIAGIQVRIFTVQHDCGHGSFARSRSLNDAVGVLCSLITVVPYHEWKRHHTLHHATAGNLDRRGHGDVWTMSVREYARASQRQRLMYRLFRHPFVMFFIGPPVLFMLMRRWPSETPQEWALERRGVHLTNVALTLLLYGAGTLLGWSAFLRIYLPVMLFMSWMGTWCFYIQHQFTHTYWSHAEHWSWHRTAFEGSSYYHLPELMRWFANNVNYHHVHHASPMIPSYNLKLCHERVSAFRQVPALTLITGLESIWLGLWSESQQKLVSFRQASQFLTREESQ